MNPSKLMEVLEASGYLPLGNTRFASPNTYVPYQIVGNQEKTANVHVT